MNEMEDSEHTLTTSLFLEPSPLVERIFPLGTKPHVLTLVGVSAQVVTLLIVDQGGREEDPEIDEEDLPKEKKVFNEGGSRDA